MGSLMSCYCCYIKLTCVTETPFLQVLLISLVIFNKTCFKLWPYTPKEYHPTSKWQIALFFSIVNPRSLHYTCINCIFTQHYSDLNKIQDLDISKSRRQFSCLHRLQFLMVAHWRYLCGYARMWYIG